MQLPYQAIVYAIYLVTSNIEIVQKIFFISLSAVCFFGIDLLINTVFKKNKLNFIYIIFCGFIYMFNPLAISIIWQRVNLGFFAYCLFPLFTYLFISYINNSKIDLKKYIFLIITYLLIFQSSNPAFVVSAIIGAVLVAIISGSMIDKKLLVRITYLYVGFIGVSLYFVLPFIFDISTQLEVANNNVSAKNIDDLRIHLFQNASPLNWLSFNPFWTSYSNIYPSAKYVLAFKYVYAACFALIIYSLLMGRSRFKAKLLKFFTGLLALIFIQLNTDPSLEIWSLLDTLKIGTAYRDPFEKLCMITSCFFALTVFGSWVVLPLSNRLKFISSLMLFGVIATPALSGNLFYQPNDSGKISPLGTLPDFYKNPHSIKTVFNKKVRLLPMPFFESSYGSAYRLVKGNFTGMTPLYWQDGTQIVSGQNAFSLAIERMLNEKIMAGDVTGSSNTFFSLLINHKIDAIAFSKNFISNSVDQASNVAFQERVIARLFHSGCLVESYQDEYLVIFKVSGVCESYL